MGGVDSDLLGKIITAASTLAVALVGYAAARRKDEQATRRKERDAGKAARVIKRQFGTLEQRIWAGIIVVMLALVVAEALAPLWGKMIGFPLEAWPILLTALMFFAYLSISGKNGGNGGGAP